MFRHGFLTFLLLAPHALRADEPLTRARVEEWLEKEQPGVRTVEEFVARLPDEWRSKYTLMAKSQNSQGSKPLAPRAILFGNDARFTIAFNTDPSSKSYRTVEWIEALPSGKLDFRQIDFPWTRERSVRAFPIPIRRNASDVTVSPQLIFGLATPIGPEPTESWTIALSETPIS